MSLKHLGHGGFRFRYDNAVNPAGSPGTSVTPGISNAEGSWTQVASGSNIAYDCYWMLVRATEGTTNATIEDHLLDIGIDPAGGTSYTPIVSNLQCGQSGFLGTGGGVAYLIPIFIPAGSSVAIRIQGAANSANAVLVMTKFWGRPDRPEYVHQFTKSETLGTITNSRGVAVTPGVSGAEGSWVEIGTTSFAWRYLIPTFNLSDGATSSQNIFLDVAVGDGTTFTVLLENRIITIPGTTEQCNAPLGAEVLDSWCNIPSGSRVFARLSTHIGTADSNYSVLVTGLG